MAQRTRSGRVRRNAGNVNGPGGVLNEEQDVDPLEGHSVDMEQIAGEDPFGLSLQELPPSRPLTPRSGTKAGAFEDVAHRAGRHPHADLGEFTTDPLITPAPVLTRHPQHHLADVFPGGRAAWSCTRVDPLAGDQTTVPAQQRRRSHEEAAPRRSRQHPRQRGQQDPISIAQVRSGHLTTQHRHLVAQRDDLDLLGTVTAHEQDQQLEETAENEVEHRPEHKQQGSLQPGHDRATNPHVKDSRPVFRTPQPDHSELPSMAFSSGLTASTVSR
jgi:hypothetical protein